MLSRLEQTLPESRGHFSRRSVTASCARLSRRSHECWVRARVPLGKLGPACVRVTPSRERLPNKVGSKASPAHVARPKLAPVTRDLHRVIGCRSYHRPLRATRARVNLPQLFSPSLLGFVPSQRKGALPLFQLQEARSRSASSAESPCAKERPRNTCQPRKENETIELVVNEPKVAFCHNLGAGFVFPNSFSR